MAKIIEIKNGRSIHVQTVYGEPIVERLRNDLAAKWDATTKTWKISKSKAVALDALIHDLGGNSPEALNAARLAKDCENILGRASFGGKSYYLVGEGANERGARVKLLFRDGSQTFFKPAVEVEITKKYQKPTTLARLQAFAEKLKAEEDESLPFVEECWECGAQYRTHGNVEDGNMGCRRCG